MSSSTKATREKRIEILVHDIRIKQLAEDFRKLPANVFPIDLSIELTRPTDDDTTFKSMRPDAYPVKVVESDHQPYIPTKKVYFDNPYEFPPQNDKWWDLGHFADRMDEIISEIRKAKPSAIERLYLHDLRLCEVPRGYASKDGNGNRSIDGSLYEDRAEMRVGVFDKRPTISKNEVREKLTNAAPGNVIQPLRLTKVHEVTAKEHRGSHQTTAASTRRRYFTDGQADQYNNPDYAPETWDFSDPQVAKGVGNVGPDAAERFFPDLSDTDFLDPVEFVGEVREDETFVEDDVNFLN